MTGRDDIPESNKNHYTIKTENKMRKFAYLIL